MCDVSPAVQVPDVIRRLQEVAKKEKLVVQRQVPARIAEELQKRTRNRPMLDVIHKCLASLTVSVAPRQLSAPAIVLGSHRESCIMLSQ